MDPRGVLGLRGEARAESPLGTGKAAPKSLQRTDSRWWLQSRIVCRPPRGVKTHPAVSVLGIDPIICLQNPGPTSNFFNDVWRSVDGIEWEQMTDAAPWAGRAGLSAAVLGGAIYVFAGSQNDDSSIIGAGGPEYS